MSFEVSFVSAALSALRARLSLGFVWTSGLGETSLLYIRQGTGIRDDLRSTDGFEVESEFEFEFEFEFESGFSAGSNVNWASDVWKFFTTSEEPVSVSFVSIVR